MIVLVALCVGFGLATAASITLLGDRQWLAKSSLSLSGIAALLGDWRLWLSMAFALLARMLFIGTNVVLSRDPRFQQASTTITTFVTASAYLFVLVANWYVLGEVVTRQQMVGAIVVVIGIVVMTR